MYEYLGPAVDAFIKEDLSLSAHALSSVRDTFITAATRRRLVPIMLWNSLRKQRLHQVPSRPGMTTR